MPVPGYHPDPALEIGESPMRAHHDEVASTLDSCHNVLLYERLGGMVELAGMLDKAGLQLTNRCHAHPFHAGVPRLQTRSPCQLSVALTRIRIPHCTGCSPHVWQPRRPDLPSAEHVQSFAARGRYEPTGL